MKAIEAAVIVFHILNCLAQIVALAEVEVSLARFGLLKRMGEAAIEPVKL